MPNIRGLVSDPAFRALSPERKRAILQRTGAEPGFIDEYAGVAPELEARREAITRPAEQGAMRRSSPQPSDPEFYGDPESLEAIREAGQFRGTAAAAGPAISILGTAALGPAIGLGVRGVGVLGGAARFAAANPNATAGAVAATPELLRGDVRGAAGTAALTAAGFKGGGGLLKFLSRFKGGGSAAAKAAQLAQAEGAAVTPEAAWFAKYGREAPEAVQAAAAAGKAAPAAVAAPSELEAALQASLAAPKAAPSIAQATVPGGYENLLLQLKDLSSTAAGRKQILEYIKTQPPEVARELRALLGPAVRSRVGVKAAAPAVQAQGVERTAEEWAKMAERLGASDIYRRLGR